LPTCSSRVLGVRPQGFKTPSKVSGKNDAENRKNDINERVHRTTPGDTLDTPYIADRGNAIWTPDQRFCQLRKNRVHAWSSRKFVTFKVAVPKPWQYCWTNLEPHDP